MFNLNIKNYIYIATQKQTKPSSNLLACLSLFLLKKLFIVVLLGVDLNFFRQLYLGIRSYPHVSYVGHRNQVKSPWSFCTQAPLHGKIDTVFGEVMMVKGANGAPWASENWKNSRPVMFSTPFQRPFPVTCIMISFDNCFFLSTHFKGRHLFRFDLRSPFHI